jgi:hypothetical protein
MQLSSIALLSVIVLGAALIALWIEVRFTEFGPKSSRARFAHFAAGMLLVGLLPQAMRMLLAHDDSPGAAMLALFLLFLPGMSYSFLGAIWLLKLLQSAMHAR